MNQFMSMQKKPVQPQGKSYGTLGAVGLAVIFFSLIVYMVKTNEVNFVTGALMILAGLLSGIAWAGILNKHDQ